MLNPNVNFDYDHYKVSVSFEGTQPSSSEELPEDVRQFRQLSNIVIEMSESEGDGPSGPGLAKLCLAEQRSELASLLLLPANRVLRGIRNFGTVVHVNEIQLEEGKSESFLRGWNVETSEDGNEWKPLLEPFGPLARLLDGFEIGQQTPELRATRWPDVEEAIQDDLEPGPEHEFLTNAIEHMRLRNFRLALLEAIVCLEIVLSQFLENYLLVEKGFSKNRLKAVLKNPQVGLTTRVGLLMELTLTANELKSVEIGEILRTVSWRNKIVHATGHLPKGLSDDEIKACIMHVLYAAHVLSRKRDVIEASPDLRDLALAIALTFKTPAPRFTPIGVHRVVCQFDFSLSDEFPDEAKMAEIVAELSRRLTERDKRFRPEEHLHVNFSEFPRKTVAVWSNGKLDVREKPRTYSLRRPPSLEPPPT